MSLPPESGPKSAACSDPRKRRCGYLPLTVFAKHSEEPEFCGLRQKLVMAFEPGLLIRQFQMKIEILPRSPILVEIEYVWIIIANVEMIVDATRARLAIDQRNCSTIQEVLHVFPAEHEE